MAIKIASAIFFLQAIVYACSLQSGINSDEDILVKFSTRLESLEARDAFLQREVDKLRMELHDEKQNTLKLKNVVNELTHRLNNNGIETDMRMEIPETKSTIMAKPETERVNVTIPEAELMTTQTSSVNVDLKHAYGESGPFVTLNKKDLFSGIQAPEDSGDVSFFANLGNHLEHLGTNQDIPFEKVVTNRGKAYSPHTGAFTAPVPGTYVFATTLYVHGFNNTHYALAQNGQMVSNIYVRGYDAPFSSSSVTVVLELEQGDVVAIRNLDLGVGLNGNSHSSFAGFLLRVDFSGNVIVGKRNNV